MLVNCEGLILPLSARFVACVILYPSIFLIESVDGSSGDGKISLKCMKIIGWLSVILTVLLLVIE